MLENISPCTRHSQLDVGVFLSKGRLNLRNAELRIEGF